MSDDPGVMGNLPRARPGRRSEKRGGAGAAKAGGRSKAGGTKAGASRSGAKASAAKGRAGTAKARGSRSGAASKPRARSGSAASPRSRPKTAEPAARSGQSSFDPVGDAVRVAGKVAGAGLKVAGGVLKRLPGR
jgi:hypothetical protein